MQTSKTSLHEMNLSGTPFRKLNGVPLKIIHSAFFPIYSISKPTTMRKLQILILCAFVLSCKSTKTVTSSNESERDAVSQVQWRLAQNHSFSSLMRNTALSFDSCEIFFDAAEPSAYKESHASYPSDTAQPEQGMPFQGSLGATSSPLHGNPSAPPQGNPSAAFHGKPSFSNVGKPTSFRIYGLHLSQSEKKKSEAASQEEDSTAATAQSSSDKSQDITKTKSSIPFAAKLAIAANILFIAAAIFLATRRQDAHK